MNTTWVRGSGNGVRMLAAVVWFGGLALPCAALAAVSDTAPKAPEPAALYDTGSASADPLSGEMLAQKTGWAMIEKAGPVKGDAVLSTAGLAVVARSKGAGIEIYGGAGKAWKYRTKLVPSGEGDWTIAGLKALASDATAAGLEVTFAGKIGKAVLSLGVEAGKPILKTTSVSGAEGLKMVGESRFGVMPDFFADDMVLDAQAIPVDKTEAPSDNFFMELLDDGSSIITAIWDKSKRDVIVTLGGEQKARAITSVEVFYGEGGSIWLAALERKGIWAQSEITAENVKKETVLKWSVPFRAKWKGNFMRADRTMDSWEFRYNLSDAASRRHWGSYTVYYWPCWFVEKPATKAMIQPPMSLPNGNYAGPFVVYPIERTPETPLDQLTVTDLMRNSLGVGPCEYVMDMAGQTVTNKGIATCGLAEAAPRIFVFGRQKEERMYLRAMLAEVQVFMQTIQDRLNSYVDFRTDILQYLEAQRAARPDLADFVRRLEDQAKRIHDKKSDAAARVAKMATDFEPGIMADAPRSNPLDILSQVKNTGQWQDATLARCRQTVKVLRQMATVEMAVNPKAADIAKELRERTHRALRSPLGHEMGR